MRTRIDLFHDLIEIDISILERKHINIQNVVKCLYNVICVYKENRKIEQLQKQHVKLEF